MHINLILSLVIFLYAALEIKALKRKIHKLSSFIHNGKKLVLFFNKQKNQGGFMNFSVDNPIVVSILEADQFGDVEATQVPPDAPPVYTVDNPALADIALASDGISGIITPKGAGVLNVSVSASFGGQALNGTGQLTLVPGAVAQITLGFAAQAPASPTASALAAKKAP